MVRDDATSDLPARGVLTPIGDDKRRSDDLSFPPDRCIRRPNHDTLEIDFTFDDPKAYTRPWNGKKIFELMPPGFEVMEQVLCEEYLDLEKKGRY